MDEQDGDAQAAEGHLEALAPKMMAALELRREGEDEQATELLGEILKAEPRLAEARLELCHMAAQRSDWEEAEAQGRLAVETLRSGGQWTLDVEPAELMSFALNLLGEVLVRDLSEGDLLMTDRPAFEARWNEASGLFKEALESDNSNRDARSNCIHYRPMSEEPSGEGSELSSSSDAGSITE